MDRAFDQARHDRALGMERRRMIENAMAQKRPVLHQSAHRISSLAFL
jgi:hypothetical protein